MDEPLNERNEYFKLTPEVKLQGEPASQLLLKIADQDAEKPVWEKRVIDLGQDRVHEVPTDCFGDENAIVFPARGKKLANDFGIFLRNKAGIQITEVVFPLIGEIGEEDCAAGFWFYRVGWFLRSGFIGDYKCLHSTDGRLYGKK